MPDIKHFNPDIVLDDAIQVFWRQGLPTTGIQALVTATGVSRPASMRRSAARTVSTPRRWTAI